MKDRIQQIIDQQTMTAAQFADTVGIQRSTLSHILNGRNNASTEIISKIHAAFPDLSISWLMFGEGNMKNTRQIKNQTLFDVFEPELSVSESNKKTVEEISTEKRQGNEPKAAVPDSFLPKTPERTIVKIMVFYSDNTFDTFSSDSTKY